MKIEIRADKSVLISGYVNAVCRDSRVMKDSRGAEFVEQVESGVFQRAIEKNDVILMHNHKRALPNKTSDNSLMLSEDSIGLHAEAIVHDEAIYERAKANRLRGWSFGFAKIADEWEDTAQGYQRRYLKDIELREVSIIDDDLLPCYRGTSIEARADGEPHEVETRGFDERDKVDIVDFDIPQDETYIIENENRAKKLEILKIGGINK